MTSRILSFLLCLGLTADVFSAETICQVPNQSIPLKVTIIHPDPELYPFWKTSISFASAVADDLDISLNSEYLKEDALNRIGFEKLIEETLSQETVPDFIITVLYGGGEYAQLQKFHASKIPFITVNTSLDENVLKLTGAPREKFNNWIGHMAPNEIQAGRHLAESLMQAKGNATLMAVLGGTPLSIVNHHRIKGANLAAKSYGVNIAPTISTDWSVDSSIKATKTLLHRVPSFDILWTAGPDIALGAIEVLEQSNKRVLVGSFDWSESNIKLIEQDRLHLSYGGHFMQPGWSLILLHDYLHGLDFSDDLGTLINSDLSKLDKSNVALIKPLLNSEQWHGIDFTRYSKCKNQSLDNYKFELPVASFTPTQATDAK